MDYGFRISKEAVSVQTGDDKDMVVTSKYPVLKGGISGGGTQSVPSRRIVTFTAATSNVITSTAHGLNNGDKITVFSDGTIPGGLVDRYMSYAQVYYVVQKATNTFKVSLTEGGSEVDITSTGSGTHYWYTEPFELKVAHGLAYIPFNSLKFYSADYGFWWDTPIGFDGASGHLYLQSYCDATYLHIIFDWEYTGEPAISVSYKYFIYLDKGKL